MWVFKPPVAIVAGSKEKVREFKPPKLSESDVTKQIRDFLEWRQWRCIRHNRSIVTMPGAGIVSFGEPGMPDLQFIRYVPTEGIPGAAIVLWLELKATGKKAQCRCPTKKPGQRCTACDQKNWKDRERKRGAVVWQIDSIELFEKMYRSTFAYLHSGDMAVGQLELI